MLIAKDADYRCVLINRPNSITIACYKKRVSDVKKLTGIYLQLPVYHVARSLGFDPVFAVVGVSVRVRWITQVSLKCSSRLLERRPHLRVSSDSYSGPT